jgi:DNA polymerase delta subunit 3
LVYYFHLKLQLIVRAALRSQYESITSIHIYSIGPHPLKDLQLLSDTSRELATLTASEDPLEFASKYGTILNPLVKRRPNRRPPVAVKPVPIAKPKAAEAVEEKEIPKPKIEQKSSQSAVAKDFFGKGKEKTKPAAGSATGSKEGSPAPPATLKRESSSIFKSFAKAKPKLKRDDTGSSAAEDVSMKGMELDDDDEEETYVAPVPVKKEKLESAGDRKTRKEREEALRKMMEDDDDDEVEAAVPTPEPQEDEEEATILEKEKPAKEEEPAVTVSGGRRRGKRRVMKKKTGQDGDGYLGMSRLHISIPMRPKLTIIK